MANLAALRAAVFSLSTKNLRGADNRPPPGRARVNPRTGGGGVISTPPLRFFADSEKNGGA